MSAPDRARRCTGDNGTALIEAAISIPILAVIVAGIFDFGMLFRQSAVVSRAKHATVRSLAVGGSARAADVLALRTLAANLASTKNITLVKVVIFQPASEASALPVSPTCFTAAAPSASAKCNVYTAVQVGTIGATSASHFGPDTTACGASAWDRNWCPLSRIDNVDGPPDWIGVYIESSYRSFTGLWLPSGFTFSDRAIMRIEPKTVIA
jgi:Flp pilus assembly protein TadG